MVGPRPVGKPWLASELARLKAAAESRGSKTWADIAVDFPGRTPMACAQQMSLIRRAARGDGRAKKPAAGERVANGRIRRTDLDVAQGRHQAPLKPSQQPSHTTLTAAICGDPLPGRSALDQMKAATA